MSKQKDWRLALVLVVMIQLVAMAYFLFIDSQKLGIPKNTPIETTTEVVPTPIEVIDKNPSIESNAEKSIPPKENIEVKVKPETDININENPPVQKDKDANIDEEPPVKKDKENYIVKITPVEIDMLVQLVQHEVGTSPSYYPGYNFDYIQQCMAKLVINRAKRSNLSVSKVIQQKGQFENWKRMFRFSKDHEITRKNVEIVLSGKDNISSNLLFQMSFKKRTLKQSLNKMQKKVGKIKPYHHVISADKRLMIFAVAHN